MAGPKETLPPKESESWVDTVRRHLDAMWEIHWKMLDLELDAQVGGRAWNRHLEDWHEHRHRMFAAIWKPSYVWQKFRRLNAQEEAVRERAGRGQLATGAVLERKLPECLDQPDAWFWGVMARCNLHANNDPHAFPDMIAYRFEQELEQRSSTMGFDSQSPTGRELGFAFPVEAGAIATFEVDTPRGLTSGSIGFAGRAGSDTWSPVDACREDRFQAAEFELRPDEERTYTLSVDRSNSVAIYLTSPISGEGKTLVTFTTGLPLDKREPEFDNTLESAPDKRAGAHVLFVQGNDLQEALRAALRAHWYKLRTLERVLAAIDPRDGRPLQIVEATCAFYRRRMNEMCEKLGDAPASPDAERLIEAWCGALGIGAHARAVGEKVADLVLSQPAISSFLLADRPWPAWRSLSQEALLNNWNGVAKELRDIYGVDLHIDQILEDFDYAACENRQELYHPLYSKWCGYARSLVRCLKRIPKGDDRLRDLVRWAIAFHGARLDLIVNGAATDWLDNQLAQLRTDSFGAPEREDLYPYLRRSPDWARPGEPGSGDRDIESCEARLLELCGVSLTEAGQHA
jgi:hypothetical protein